MSEAEGDPWARLREQALASSGCDEKGRLFELMRSEVGGDVFRGVRLDGGQRLVAVPAGTIADDVDVPHCAGFTCEVTTHPWDDADGRRLLLLEEVPGEVPPGVFEALCQDLIDVLVGAANAAAAMLERVRAWAAFFETTGGAGLSRSARRGLFGELTFLEQELAPRIGLGAAVLAWTGARRTDQDFQWDGFAAEVKTTTVVAAGRIGISSLRQLDDRGLDGLLLAVVRINEHRDGGDSLTMLVARIRETLGVVAASVLARFNDSLLRAGLADDVEARSHVGFAIRGIEHFAVEDGFPRLLPEQLPNGIGAVSYELELSACEAWRVDFGAWRTGHNAGAEDAR